jgi:hypothetical protein
VADDEIVTEVPAQTLFVFSEIEIAGVILGNTFIISELEVAGLPIAHDMLEYTIQLTTSPFMGIYEKVGKSAPALVPLTCHW